MYSLILFILQIRFNLASSQTAFIINYVTLIMEQDVPKRRFLSLIFLVSLFLNRSCKIQDLNRNFLSCIHFKSQQHRTFFDGLCGHEEGLKGIRTLTFVIPVQWSTSCAIRPTGSWSLCGSIIKPIDGGYKSIYDVLGLPRYYMSRVKKTASITSNFVSTRSSNT